MEEITTEYIVAQSKVLNDTELAILIENYVDQETEARIESNGWAYKDNM